jgi:hypothetical protein
LPLTCLCPLHTVSFHSCLFLLTRGREMGPSLIQRQCMVTPYGFPVVIHALPSFQTRYSYPWSPVAKFLKPMPERSRSCSFSQCWNEATKIKRSMVQERI